MRALIWKEVRELAPGFWLLVTASWVLGVVDVTYNWREERAVGISLAFVWLVSMVGALLAGANSFARETREQMVFLGSWPIPRMRIWLAKVLVPAVMWAAFVALAFGGCVALLALRGYGVHRAGNVIDPAGDPAATGVAWALLFGAGLVASVALPSAMVAAVVALVLCFGTVWGYTVLWADVPDWFGPSLGLVLPDIGEVSHLPAALVFLALCVILSAIVAARHLLGEWSRRAWLTLAGFAATVALVLVLGLVVAWVALRPERPTADSVTVEASGHWMVIDSEDGALWAVDVDGERLHPFARGPAESLAGLIPGSERVEFVWARPELDQGWVADLAGGGLWRLPAGGGPVSPAGHYCVTQEGEALTVHPVGPAPHDAVTLALGGKTQQTIGWSPDEETMYVSVEAGASGVEDHKQRLLAVRPFDGGEARTVATLDAAFRLGSLSPDGRWGELYTPLGGSGDQATHRRALLDLGTGEMVPLHDLNPWWQGWTTDGRYLWCSSPYFEELDRRYVAVFDLERREVARTITVADTRGVVPYHGNVSPHSPQVLIFAGRRSPAGEPQREWWLANPDGSELRPAPIPPTARIAGWTYDGDFVYWDAGEIHRSDPETGTGRMLRALQAAQ